MAAALGAPTRLAACGLSTRRRACLAAPAAAAAAAGRPTRHPRSLLVVSASGKPISEADLYQAAPSGFQQPLGQPAGPAGQPWYVIAPLAFLAVIAALRTVKAVKKRMAGEGRLAERGFKRGGGVSDDRAYSKALKGVRTVKFEDLPDDVIQAARRRRQKDVERDMAPLDLDSIELPDNHPFAVKKKLDPAEEDLQRSRLSVRRGGGGGGSGGGRLSAEDLQRLREQQALADQMDAEGEARDAANRRQQGRG